MGVIMNEKLQKYLDEKVMPKNDLNDEGHNAFHVNYVRRRSMKFAIMIGNVNLDMVDTIAVYHDVGHSIDSKNHEKISAKILYEDENLREFFDEGRPIEYVYKKPIKLAPAELDTVLKVSNVNYGSLLKAKEDEISNIFAIFGDLASK